MAANRLGVLFVGLNGATANTSVVGAGLGSHPQARVGSIIAALLQNRAFPDESDFVFGGWDLTAATAYERAITHAILPRDLIEEQRERLSAIAPMKAYVGDFDISEVSTAANVHQLASLSEGIQHVREDIAQFRRENSVATCIVVYLGSPLRQPVVDPRSLDDRAFSRALRDPSSPLPSAVVYALGAIEMGCAFVDFTPNVTLEIPQLLRAAAESRSPVAGRDGSTGQTFMKVVLAEMLRVRNLRVDGWYSANILGNSDGDVLTRPGHRELKLRDKRDVLPPILGYDDFEHVVDISFYGPRGDNKESWDVVDLSAWLGQAVSFRINWQGRDSVLAAPLVLDLVKHMAESLRRGESGLQEHLAVYFKRPLGCGVIPLSESVARLEAFYGERSSDDAH